MPTLLLCLKGARRMETMEKLKALIEPLLAQSDLRLYELAWRKEGNMDTLQVAIMHEDGSMDIDTCALISEQLSQCLDESDLIAHEYFLEVCSPGAERVLNNETQLKAAIGEYIYIKYRDPKAGRHELYGTLEDMDEQFLYMTYMDKNIKRKLDVERANIAYVRLAVKL